MYDIELSDAQVARFHQDGFLVLDKLLEPEEIEAARARFGPMFRGEFATGLQPDEWNWREGRDADHQTRQICNGWKSDPVIASLVLAATVGRLCTQLSDWAGARIAQDNVLWKPPGAAPLGFHQDNSYIKWSVPAHYVTCWMALDETTAAGGTLEYVPGSHTWGSFPPIRQFHDPDDYRECLHQAAAAAGRSAHIVPIEVPAGGCAFHHGELWHGSDRNRGGTPRRSLVSHCIASNARFHPTEVGYVYSRYKRHCDCEMDESFFPILWTRDGYRSPFLAPA